MLKGKTINEIIKDENMKRISTDIRQNCNLVRNEFGQMNNEAFMLPMMVLQNIQMLEQLSAINESLVLMVENSKPSIIAEIDKPVALEELALEINTAEKIKEPSVSKTPIVKQKK